MRHIASNQIALSCQIVLISLAWAAPATAPPDPRPTIEEFCKAQFDGEDTAAAGMITLSKARQDQLRQSFQAEHPGEPLPLADMIGGNYPCQSVVVVGSYRVLGEASHGNTATAQVEYVVYGAFKLGIDDHCATEFIANYSKAQRLTLRLRFSNGEDGLGGIRRTNWYVEDPPTPRVSLEALLTLCKTRQERFRDIAQGLKDRGKPVPPNIAWGIATYGRKAQILSSLKASP
jgi:hypothetical protein